MGGVVQDDRLGQVPLQDAQVFDVVALNADTILLIQAMPAGETQTLKVATPEHNGTTFPFILLVHSLDTPAFFLHLYNFLQSR